MQLKGKTAIITGGTRGIGKAIVQAFSREGARVLFTYAKNTEMSDALAQEIRAGGGFAEGYQLDVRDYDGIVAWKNEVLEKHAQVDIVVNNAGIIRDKAMMMMTREDWLDVIDTNLNGLFNITKQFAVPFMKQRSGVIINMASLSGVIGLPRQVNYAASKGGMIAFTKSLAKELAPFNVRVNAIAPGFIETDMTAGLNQDFLHKAVAQVPLSRVGTAAEVAGVAVFLASDAASYITGEVINVAGGMGM